MLEKPVLRKLLLAARKNFPPNLRAAAAEKIISAVLTLPTWQSARTVGCYLSLPEEVPTAQIVSLGLKSGKLMAAPVITQLNEPMRFYQLALNQKTQAGPLGIMQPPQDQLVAAESLDLLVVPGVGFDLHGNRLGYGKGFYDQYLAAFKGITLGLAYDLQVVDELPATSRDCPLQMLVTESRVLYFD
jgi:5-formyltetrahydrofolate cyclo-ligase